MITNGRWNDVSGANSYPGVIEVAGADADGDGLPDTVDLYPNDPLNVFDLRAAGADGVFDSADDQVYRLKSANYTSGLNVSFSLINGPLQPGNYRFTVTPSLRDRFGNTLAAPFARYFSVGNVPGYVVENRANNTAVGATPLTQLEDPIGLKSASGRGKLFDVSDVDFWSFNGAAGDWLTLAVGIPGNPGGSGLYYRINKPDGSLLSELYAGSNGSGLVGPLALPTNGVYTVAVSRYNNYFGEYDLRVSSATPPLVMEAEDNGSIGTATPVTLTANGNSRLGSVAGCVQNSSDLDDFSLGTITNGSTVFLNARLPASSGLIPVVSIYNSSNGYIDEAPGGRASDGVAQVNITQTGVYYAVVRGGSGTGGLSEQYVLDVQVVPTGSVSFPNLQIVSVTPPGGSSIQSGQPVNFSFTAQNIGSVATPTANWSDRVVISQNTVLGDGDDVQLGIYPHSGVLNPGASYTANQTAALPDGISGPYYLIVQTDSGNAINEFLLEGDNVTASSSTFNVNLAPYPDLKVENLAVSGPGASNVYTMTWTTANRGNAAANGGFKERVFVKNLTSGAVVLNVEQNVADNLAVNATLARSATLTATAPGNYQVQVTTDSQNNFFEYDALSHAGGEQNTAETEFVIVQYFNISVSASPAGGGAGGGGGSFPAGANVIVTGELKRVALSVRELDRRRCAAEHEQQLHVHRDARPCAGGKFHTAELPACGIQQPRRRGHCLGHGHLLLRFVQHPDGDSEFRLSLHELDRGWPGDQHEPGADRRGLQQQICGRELRRGEPYPHGGHGHVAGRPGDCERRGQLHERPVGHHLRADGGDQRSESLRLQTIRLEWRVLWHECDVHEDFRDDRSNEHELCGRV